MIDTIYKYPRLYLNMLFDGHTQLLLSMEQTHYLRNVLRKEAGDMIRVFNGRDGEFLARIVELGKKGGIVSLERLLREQGQVKSALHLCFAPIKKQRLDILIEKAVELGVSAFHPVLTNRTENRNLNIERLLDQIIEAAEQCERLDVPVLHAPRKLPVLLKEFKGVPLYACLERQGAKSLRTYRFDEACGFLIGPEGGFDPEEMALVGQSGAIPVDLGETILRAETAALACLSYARLSIAV